MTCTYAFGPRSRTRTALLAAVLLTVPVTLAVVPGSAAAAALAATRVEVGEPVFLTGKVPASVETVVIQRHVPGAWEPVTTVPVRDGEYRVQVPTDWYGKFTYRAVDGADKATVITRSTERVKVTPDYRPAGRATDHELLSTPVARWDPCTKIRYRVNLERATRGAMRDIRGAIRRIEQATGLSFAYEGRTSNIPQGTLTGPHPANTDFVIAWATRRESKLLRSHPSAAGVGGPEYQYGFQNSDGSSVSRITYGQVVLDATQTFKRGFGMGQTRGELLMHEVAHALGVGHTMSPSQIMYPMMQDGTAQFGRGDLAALAKVGASQGCIHDGDQSLGSTGRR